MTNTVLFWQWPLKIQKRIKRAGEGKRKGEEVDEGKRMVKREGGYDQPVNGFFVFMNVYNHLTFWSPPGDILQRQVPSAHSLKTSLIRLCYSTCP